MKMPTISLVEWQKRFGTENACIKTLEKVRWPQGFQCPACGSEHYSFIATRKKWPHSLNHQVSVYSCAAQPPRRHSPIPRGGWVASNSSFHQLVEFLVWRGSRQCLMGSNHIVSHNKLLNSLF